MVYNVKVVCDLEFAAPNGKPLLLDLYLPIGGEKPLPVIVWLHGGGWRIGDRKLGPDFRVRFAERGYAMASIEYRLSGEATFPAQIYDVKAAVRWLRSSANEFGLDSDHIGLWGSSAGGHLAALAGTTGEGILENLELGCAEFSSDVQAVVDGYGPTDFLQMDAYTHNEIAVSIDPESDLLQPPRQHEDKDSPESQLLGAPIQSVPDLVKKANPISYVKNGLPPFLIMHGLSDKAVAPHQSELLYQALIAKGNEATLCLIEGLGHAFFNKNELDDNEPYSASIRRAGDGETEYIRNREIRIFEMIEEFFQKHLLGN
ncbi:alpha/beta hydrolase [Neobacillus sp. 3P2-tot-E-2]|uniref:alpha/beta hydrolase fold domain-containing protein n=1 Tax=Neobacillus sp. 3P2-tot-E-2 TaxID=3132212 RepID=UPI0039A23059